MSSKNEETKKINWETVKTIIITAFVFSTLGVIGGYFATINLHSDARAAVMSDMKAVAQTNPKVVK